MVFSKWLKADIKLHFFTNSSNMKECEQQKKGDLSITSWNINYDHRAFSIPKWNTFDWPARKEAVIETILRCGTDFICLQELRKESVLDLMGNRRLSEVYDMTYGRTNSTDLASCLVTLWKKDVWACSKSEVLWFGQQDMKKFWEACPGGNIFGRIVLVTTFFPAVDPRALPPVKHFGIQPIVIYNIHFGLPEPERIHEAHLMHKLIAKRIAKSSQRALTYAAIANIVQHTPVVACGDFNSFADAGGHKQMDIVEIKTAPFVMADNQEKLFTLKDGICLTGTQQSYPYDTYFKYAGTDHQELHPNEGEMGGHLDHVLFTSKCLNPIDVRLLTWKTDGTIAEASDFGFHKDDTLPRFPSDHFPLRVRFDIIQ